MCACVCVSVCRCVVLCTTLCVLRLDNVFVCLRVCSSITCVCVCVGPSNIHIICLFSFIQRWIAFSLSLFHTITFFVWASVFAPPFFRVYLYMCVCARNGRNVVFSSITLHSMSTQRFQYLHCKENKERRVSDFLHAKFKYPHSVLYAHVCESRFGCCFWLFCCCCCGWRYFCHLDLLPSHKPLTIDSSFNEFSPIRIPSFHSIAYAPWH